jgi:hypothetical protein
MLIVRIRPDNSRYGVSINREIVPDELQTSVFIARW